VHTWTNKAFQITPTATGAMAHMVDRNGVFIFRWRMYYDAEIYEDFSVPVGVIEHFETFKALCRQFDNPADVKQWYLKRINRNGRK
jgi:hypothetical protein